MAFLFDLGVLAPPHAGVRGTAACRGGCAGCGRLTQFPLIFSLVHEKTHQPVEFTTVES